MSKKEDFTEVEETPAANETTALTANQVDFCDIGEIDTSGIDQSDFGSLPFLKAPRGPKAGNDAGTITLDGEQIMAEANGRVAMLVLSNRPKYYVTYESIKDEQTGKWVPKARFQTLQEALDAGYSDQWQDLPGGKRKGPEVIPVMDFHVLVEAPSGAIAIAGRNWAHGILSCWKKDYVVAQKFLKKWAGYQKQEGYKPWMLEWSLGLTRPDNMDNHWLVSDLVTVHKPDSDFAAEFTDVMGV